MYGLAEAAVVKAEVSVERSNERYHENRKAGGWYRCVGK